MLQLTSSAAEIRIGRSVYTVGLVALVSGIVCYVGWATGGTRDGEIAFLWLGATFLASVGATLTLAGWALWHRWPSRWLWFAAGVATPFIWYAWAHAKLGL